MGFEALVILLFFFLPGMITDALYRFFLWKPEPKGDVRLFRAALFSAAGILLLLVVDLISDRMEVLPQYLFVNWSEGAILFGREDLSAVLASWGLHVAASLVMGIAVGFTVTRPRVEQLVEAIVGQSLYEDAWQEFVQKYFDSWVVVRTVSGHRYYGRLGIVSGHGDRAIVLWNPAGYSKEDGRAIIEVDGTKGVYLPEAQVAEISVSFSDEEVEAASRTGVLGRYDLATGRRLV